MITLISCDPIVNYEKIINNQTDHNISLIVLGTDSLGNNVPVDTILINKQTEKVIYNEGGIGQVQEYQNCPGAYYLSDSHKTKLDNDTLLSLDSILEMPSKWKFKVIKESKVKGGSCQCKLIIHPENIN